jgi:hypothetical protein
MSRNGAIGPQSLNPALRPFITDWGMRGILNPVGERERLLFGQQPLRLGHSLHTSPLFARAALARLIETYPRAHYSLIAMGAAGENKAWREGDLGGASGETVLDAIAAGRLWLNLRNTSGVDDAHGAMLDGLFRELRAAMPGFAPRSWQSGILISSPSAQVYYHADLPGQLLWQIAGRKRVFLYPNSAPFITAEQLEDIALFDVEVDIPYAPWYDEHARVLELAPGQMLSWPLNAPHRVENIEGVNISMTVSFSSTETRRREIVHLANGLLRHRFGIPPRSRRIEGAGFYAKAALQKLLRDGAWVQKQRAARRAVEFKLETPAASKMAAE